MTPPRKILLFISLRLECADICKLALNEAHLRPVVVLLEFEKRKRKRKERIGLIKIDLWHSM